MTNVIISITTIPKRKDMFLTTLPYILHQKYTKKICINLDNNLSKEDYDFYDKLVEKDSRIEINKECDPKWRSANKLLPTIKKYPEDVIVTMDDDLSYDEHCVEELVKVYEKNSDCIICQEINPVITFNNELYYLNTMDVKLMQKEYGKYLTHSCLFPPHTFDNTDVFDYQKMMKLTQGTHDELWFWEQSTLKGIKVIGLDWTMTMAIDSTIQHKEDEYQLTNINKFQDKINEYNNAFNKEYSQQIKDFLNNENTFIEFNINRSNLLAHAYSFPYLKQLYNGYKIKFVLAKDLKKSHLWFLNQFLNNAKFNHVQVEVEK